MVGYEKKGVAKWALRKWLKRKGLSKVAITSFRIVRSDFRPHLPVFWNWAF
jgi:hypothetical protein